MTAQAIATTSVEQAQIEDVSFAVFFKALGFSAAIATVVLFSNLLGTPGLFMSIGIVVLSFCAYVAFSTPATTVKSQSVFAIASNAASVVTTSVTPSTDEIVCFFNDLEAFDWKFEDKYKFQADRKLYFKSKFKSLIAQATSPELTKILNDFRAHHYDAASKPVISSYL